MSVLQVLRVLWRVRGPIGTVALARESGLSRQAVHALTRFLLARRIVVAVRPTGRRPEWAPNEACELWPMLVALFEHEDAHARSVEDVLRQAIEADPAIAAAWLIDGSPTCDVLEVVAFVPGCDAAELAGRLDALRDRLRAGRRVFGLRARVSGLLSDDFPAGVGPPPPGWLRVRDHGRPLLGPPIDCVLITGTGRTFRRWEGLMVVG